MTAAVTRVLQEFDCLTKAGSQDEIKLFRALVKALHAAAPTVVVEEYHGSGHQLWHTTAASVGLGSRRCELSDLMMITYHATGHPAPRLSYLQAKYERVHRDGLRNPHADYVQWSLLSSKPTIAGCANFQPPSDLLSASLLPSIGSFGFFVDGSSRKAGRFDLAYAAADLLAPTHTPVAGRKSGRLRLTGGELGLLPLPGGGHQDHSTSRCINGYDELSASSSLGLYLESLFALRVGSPLVRRPQGGGWWLSQELRRLTGPLAQHLADVLSNMPRPDNAPQEALDYGGERSTANVPAKRLIIMRVDEQETVR